MRTIALRIGLLAAVGVGAIVLQPFLSGNVGELKVGECFDVPTVTETVEDVQHHPCTDAHDGEVFFVGTHAAAKDTAYPADAALTSEIEGACAPAFNTYTGLDFATDPVWSFGYFYPLKEGWEGGDRGFICYASRIDEAPTNTSVKKA
jgi:hypothetical protein